MLTGIILLSIMGFVGIISYRRPRLEQRVFRKIPLVDWLNILIIPIIMYYGLILIVKNILERVKVEVLDYDEFTLLGVGVLFLVYTFVGNSIHFVGKVLSRYMIVNKRSYAYQVNEMFHGKMSHYISFVCIILVLFVIAILEVNYPLPFVFTVLYKWLIILAGGVFGVFS